MKPILVAGLLVAATIAVGFMAADDTQRAVVKKPFDGNVAKGPSKGGTPQILWHGGSVLNQAIVPVFVIYYGSTFPSTTQAIVNAFLAGLTSLSTLATIFRTVSANRVGSETARMNRFLER